LALQNETVSLSPESCILNAVLQPSAFLCKGGESTDDEDPWSTQKWTRVLDEYDSGPLEVVVTEGYISGLTPCYHQDRFVVLVEACMGPECTPSIPSDDIFEFTFEHPSGKRAIECLGKPKLAYVSAGRTAAAVVGGGIAGSLGSSVGGSISGSTAGSAGGAMALIGVVQFLALLAENCGAQADIELQDFLALLTPVQVFNLRIPMPEIPIFNPLKEWNVAMDISFCGYGGVALIDQARADVGELFSSNVVIGMLLLAVVTFVHLLMLQPPFPKWRRVMRHTAPWLKWETMILLTAYQGLLVSSFQMIAMDEPVCKYAGFTVLTIPTLFLLFVAYLLLRYVRPSSSERQVNWDDLQGEWISGSQVRSFGDHSPAPQFGRKRKMRTHVERKVSIQKRNSIALALVRSITEAEIGESQRHDGMGDDADAGAEAGADVRWPHVPVPSLVTADVGTPATAVGLSIRMVQNLKESASAEFLDRFAHMFDAYVNVRGAWSTLLFMLVQQYVMAAFLGLAVPSGGCGYEQV
jgi:hypothetical protein